MLEQPRVVALSGGVGGARLAHGLAQVLPADRLSVIVNTADDFRHYGLHIAPDVDTVLYTLAGQANPATGWGLKGDTARVMAALRALGDDAWFHLGDRDLATHLVRTARLAAGATLTEVTAELGRALGVGPAVLPATDDPLATVIRTAEGELAFQDWFVRRHCRPPATGVRYEGADRARPTAAVLSALAAADLVVIGPSNPYLSILPMLVLPSLGAALAETRAVRLAVSPLIGGAAVKGPAAEMLRDLAGGTGPAEVARLYAGFIEGLVIDRADAGAVDELGSLAVHVTTTLVPRPVDRRRLAGEVLAFAGRLRAQRSGR